MAFEDAAASFDQCNSPWDVLTCDLFMPEKLMKKQLCPQIRAFYSACPSHQVAPFAFEAMLWKMEVASERLEMSMP